MVYMDTLSTIAKHMEEAAMVHRYNGTEIEVEDFFREHQRRVEAEEALERIKYLATTLAAKWATLEGISKVACAHLSRYKEGTDGTA
jgi:hypothetical protein